MQHCCQPDRHRKLRAFPGQVETPEEPNGWCPGNVAMRFKAFLPLCQASKLSGLTKRKEHLEMHSHPHRTSSGIWLHALGSSRVCSWLGGALSFLCLSGRRQCCMILGMDAFASEFPGCPDFLCSACLYTLTSCGLPICFYHTTNVLMLHLDSTFQLVFLRRMIIADSISALYYIL